LQLRTDSHIFFFLFFFATQLPHTPPLPIEPRSEFLKKRSLRVLALFLTADAANVYMSLNPVFDPSSACDSPLTCQGRALGALNLLAFAVAPYAVINFGYDALSVVAVASGLSEARYWPDFFGPPSEVYTVRRFWG
jgi:hypothetical protein